MEAYHSNANGSRAIYQMQMSRRLLAKRGRRPITQMGSRSSHQTGSRGSMGSTGSTGNMNKSIRKIWSTITRSRRPSSIGVPAPHCYALFRIALHQYFIVFTFMHKHVIFRVLYPNSAYAVATVSCLVTSLYMPWL